MLAAVITWVMTLSAPNRPRNSHSARCAMAQPCMLSVRAVGATRRAIGRARRLTGDGETLQERSGVCWLQVRVWLWVFRGALCADVRKVVGRFSLVVVINDDGHHQTTHGHGCADRGVSPGCGGGWTASVRACVVGARGGACQSDSARASRALCAVQRRRAGGVVASTDEGSVAVAWCDIAHGSPRCTRDGRAP